MMPVFGAPKKRNEEMLATVATIHFFVLRGLTVRRHSMFKFLIAALVVVIASMTSAFATEAQNDEIKLVSRVMQKAEFWKSFDSYTTAILIDGNIEEIAVITYEKIEKMSETNFVAANALATAHRRMAAQSENEKLVEHLRKAAHFYDQATILSQSEDERQTMTMASIVCKLILGS